jgi:hypothetical protein
MFKILMHVCLYIVLYLCLCMFGLTIILTESRWQCDFVEARECKYAKITMAHRDSVKLGNPKTQFEYAFSGCWKKL